jgi:hypothetical protein
MRTFQGASTLIPHPKLLEALERKAPDGGAFRTHKRLAGGAGGGSRQEDRKGEEIQRKIRTTNGERLRESLKSVTHKRVYAGVHTRLEEGGARRTV